MYSDDDEPKDTPEGLGVAPGKRTPTAARDSAEGVGDARPKSRRPLKRRLSSDSQKSTDSTLSGESIHRFGRPLAPPTVSTQPRGPAIPAPRVPLSRNSSLSSEDFDRRLRRVDHGLRDLREQGNLDDDGSLGFSTGFNQGVHHDYGNPYDVPHEEEDNFRATAGETTSLSFDTPPTKAPKTKDNKAWNDKAWKALRKKLMDEAKVMGFKSDLSSDTQTIRMLNASHAEQMRVERQTDKTLKLSSQPPTSPEQLMRLFLVTGSKTCNLNKAESPEVAAKIYEALSTKANIKLTLSDQVLEQLKNSGNPEHKAIAQNYLQKKASAQPTTGTSRKMPLAPAESPLAPVKSQAIPSDETVQSTTPPIATETPKPPTPRSPRI